MSSYQKGPIEALQERLRENCLLSKRGYDIAINDNGDLLVCRRGHWRGLWRHVSGQYSWVVAGSREPGFVTGDIEKAVCYTVKHVFVA